jgi:hypothetical protein
LSHRAKDKIISNVIDLSPSPRKEVNNKRVVKERPEKVEKEKKNNKSKIKY